MFWGGGTIPIQETKNDLQSPGIISLGKENGSFTIHLDSEYKGCEIYFIARNLKRDVESTNKIRYYGPNTDSITRVRAAARTEVNFGDYGSFNIYASMGNVKKRACNTIGNVSGFSDIEDYVINLGEYQETVQDIIVSLDTPGDYSYDSIEVLAVPHESYEKQADFRINHAYDVSLFADNYVSGTVDTVQDSTILYLSVPFNLGWKAYVDEREVEIRQVDIAFMGIPIDGSGKHKVELRYRPVGYKIGIVLFFWGLILCVGVCVWHQRIRKHTVL